jgi:hypothetical protein
MKMKRVGKLIGLAAVAAVMMCTAAGCTLSLKSTIQEYGVYDTSVPEDQLCDLFFIGVDIKTFNGKPVNWNEKKKVITVFGSEDGGIVPTKSGDIGTNMGRIKVPAGTHDFVYDFEWQDVGESATSFIITWRTIRDLEISQIEFLPGHRYSLYGTTLGNTVKIYMQDITNARADMYEDTIAKAPKISKTPTAVEGNWKGSDATTLKFAGNTWEMDMPPEKFPGNFLYTSINSYNYTSITGLPGNYAKIKGTFEIDGDKITLYHTHAGRGSMWISVASVKAASIWTYSFEGETLNLERSKTSIWTYSIGNNKSERLNFEELPPNIVYTKQ